MKRGKIRIKQRDMTDCGAACLAAVAQYHRLQVPVSRIRQYAGTDKKGTTVLGLTAAAEKLGFEAKGAKGQIKSLPAIPLPAIAHLVLQNGLHHYVVLYAATNRRITYMDPADGQIHRVTPTVFEQTWSGVIVLLLPREDFRKGKEGISNIARCWQLIRPHKNIMVQALAGALIYTLLGLSTSVYLQKIVDVVLTEGNTRLLNLMSFLMIIVLAFQLIIGAYKTIFGLYTGQMIDARLILGYYRHILQLPQYFFDTMRAGEIISRVNDAVKIREFINTVALNMVVNVLIVIFSLVLMFFYYWKLALLMLAIVPLYCFLYWLSNRVNKKWQRRLGISLSV